METYRSVLFVDFDNVYTGLGSIDPEAARMFATDPRTWVDWLAAGSDQGGAFQRRFLVRNCYLNPVEHSRFRVFFTRAGFRVVDCPPLTNQGKNSADIHMVLDVVDAMAHPGPGRRRRDRARHHRETRPSLPHIGGLDAGPTGARVDRRGRDRPLQQR